MLVVVGRTDRGYGEPVNAVLRKTDCYCNPVCATYDDQRAASDGAARGRERFEL
jgi:hypothetical protein